MPQSPSKSSRPCLSSLKRSDGKAGRFDCGSVWILAIASVLLVSIPAAAQWDGRDGWVEEPAAKSLNVEGDPGHAYLDPASVHRGDDGLIYFNESANVSRPDEIGKVGFMKDAYDCAKNIKYMCVGIGHWRNDTKSTVDTTNDPALPIYRKYLCEDAHAGEGKVGARP